MRVDPGPFSAGGLHLLVIDEAQDLYRPRREAGMLWSAMKSLAAGSEGDSTLKQLRIVVKERPQGDGRNEAMRWQWLNVQSS